jgi:hypothetical protein
MAPGKFFFGSNIKGNQKDREPIRCYSICNERERVFKGIVSRDEYFFKAYNRSNAPSLVTTLFPSGSVDILFEDDVTIIPFLGVYYMLGMSR